MKRRALAVLMASLFPVVAACGASTELSEPQDKGEVTVKGAFNKAPEVSWPEDFSAGKLKVKVLIKGTGEVVTPATKSVYANYWMASAEGTPEQAVDSYSAATKGSDGSQQIPYSKDQSFPVFATIYSGKYTIGSRLLVTGWAQNTFGGEGNPNIGVGRDDSTITVIDIVKKVSAEELKKSAEAEASASADAEASASASAEAANPKVRTVERKALPMLTVDPANRDKVVGLKWKDVPKPDNNGDVLITYVKKGTGAKLTGESTVKAKYYGSLYQSKTPFDSSFSRGDDPTEFPLSGVIPGWKSGLTGVPVGSRVVLGIPSRYGYGEAGSGETIPGNSYLYFYVEVVSAS